jgi:ABC-type uncharacterized transport system ATPase subunit
MVHLWRDLLLRRMLASVTGARSTSMSTNHTILEMRSITKEFPGVKALSDVSIQVRAGEIHAICGENGAGKSTLMSRHWPPARPGHFLV